MPRKFGRGKGKAKVSKAVKKFVARKMDSIVEDKFRLTQQGSYAAPITTVDYTTGYIALLNGMIQGTGEEQRIGDSYKIKTLELRYDLTGATAGGVGGQSRARIMLILDMNNNGGALSPATTVYSDVFNNAITIGTGGVVNTYNENTHNKRYRILYDRIHNLEASAAYVPGVGAAVVYPGTVTKRVFKRFKRPIRVQCNNNNSGFNQDIIKNSIYFLAFSDIASAAAGPAPILVASSKMTYEDA